MNLHPIERVKDAIKWIADTITSAVKWAGGVLTEPDSNGGKASFSRLAGAYVIFKIVALVETAIGAGKQFNEIVVPEAYMTMFWVLIGYAIVSKLLSQMSPAVLDIAKAILIKVANVPIPKPEEIKPAQ